MKRLTSIRTALTMTQRNGQWKKKRTSEHLAFKPCVKVHAQQSRRVKEDQTCIYKEFIPTTFWRTPSTTKLSHTSPPIKKTEKTWLLTMIARKVMTVLKVTWFELSWILPSSRKTPLETCRLMLTHLPKWSSSIVNVMLISTESDQCIPIHHI